MVLKYRIERRYLITDHPSHPWEHRTEFLFTPDGRLALREEPSAPWSYFLRRK
jgi:hypothetical protein